MNKIFIKIMEIVIGSIFVTKWKVLQKPMLLCLALCFIICQILYAEKDTAIPTEKSSMSIIRVPYLCESSSATIEQDRIVDWEYFFKKTNIRNNDMYMNLFEALNYRDYDITEFVKDMGKYGGDPILWLAQKNASSGRLTIAEKTVTSVISTKKIPEGLSYAYELLGNIKLAQKKTQEAALAYRLAIEAGNVNMYPNLAFASIAAGDFQTVKSLIPKLMKVKNKNTSALETLVAFSRITNDVKLFRKSIEGVGESSLAANPRMFLNVLVWLFKIGDPSDLLMADRLQRAHPESLGGVIELLRKSGTPDDLKLADALQDTVNTIREDRRGQKV